MRDSFRKRVLASTIIIPAMLVSACQTTGGAGAYAPQANDFCYAEYQALRDTGGAFEDDYVANVLAGAAIGALIGLAGSALTTGEIDLGTVLIGAAVGALSGAAKAYLEGKAKQAEREQQLYQSVAGDVLDANQNIDASQIAFNQLFDCRQRETDAVRAAFQAGTLPQDEAEARMADIRFKFEQELKLAREINEDIQERQEVFTDTTAAVNGIEELPPAPPEPTAVENGDGYLVLRNANVRSGPGTNNPRLALLTAGETVSVLAEVEDWFQIEYRDGQIGYTAQFLLAEPGSPEYLAARPDTQAPATGGTTVVVAQTPEDVTAANDLIPLAQSTGQKSEAYAQSLDLAATSLNSGGFVLGGTGLSRRDEGKRAAG